MQLTVAAWFAAQALFTLVVAARYAQVVTGVVIAVFAVLFAVASYASVRGSRRMFRIALYVLALAALSAFVNLLSFTGNAPATPLWELVVSELISIWGLGLLVWLSIGQRRYGPWAMKEKR